MESLKASKGLGRRVLGGILERKETCQKSHFHISPPLEKWPLWAIKAYWPGDSEDQGVCSKHHHWTDPSESYLPPRREKPRPTHLGHILIP